MLFAVFQVGIARYAVDASQIVEVLPALDISPVMSAPAGVAGVFNYHGESVPVVDFCALIAGSATPNLLSTRMLLVRERSDSNARLFALLVPGATETVRREPSEFVPSSVGYAGSASVAPDNGRFLHRIDIRRLLAATLGSTHSGVCATT